MQNLHENIYSMSEYHKSANAVNPVYILLLLIVLAACAPDTPPTPTAIALADMPKQLATLFASPTPNDAERQATLAAVRASTPIAALPTIVPTETPYIGVFLGASSRAANLPQFDQPLPTTIAQASTPGAPPCVIPIDTEFSLNWELDPSIREGLRCPTEPAFAYVGVNQLFERGVMYYLPSGEIYTFTLAGDARGRLWYAPQAPPDQGWTVDAPPGLRMPISGFGAVWKAVDGVRQALGFARTEEQSVSLRLQRFEGGALLLDGSAGQTFALVGLPSLNGEGRVYGPF
jgi:hypothetical protein